MNKNQWYTLAIGFEIFGILLLSLTIGDICVGLKDTGLLISCYIRRYAYAIPGMISFVVGLLFMFCAWLEPKRK